MMNLASDSSLLTLVEANEINILEKQIKKNLNEFNNYKMDLNLKQLVSYKQRTNYLKVLEK